MIWSTGALLVPPVAVWLWLRGGGSRSAAASAALTAALAVGIALGLSSLFTFWWVVVTGGLGARFAAADALVWTTAAVFAGVRLRRRARMSQDPGAPSSAPPTPRATVLARTAFAVIAALAASAALIEYQASPQGHPDATLIWNLKARFMTLGGDRWADFVAVPRSNPSHPLLVSASVARLWRYAGDASTHAPAALGVATAAAIAAAVIGALDPRRVRAWIAGCVLVAPATFSRSAVAQTADLACGLYLLAALIVLAGYGSAARMPQPRRLMMAGMLAGLMGWTKNEGLVFVAIAAITTVAAAVRRKGSAPVAWLLAGAAPALIAVAWLKIVLAPVAPEYFAETELSPSYQDRLLDPIRQAALGQALWQEAWRWGGPLAAGSLPLAVVAAVTVTVRREGRRGRLPVTVLALMIAAYLGVWLTTPLDPAWLVSQTFERVLVQLWPSFVLVAFADGVPSSIPRAAA